MGKPNLKTVLLVVIGLIAAAIFITKAMIPWVVNPVKKWEQQSINRIKDIKSLDNLKKKADAHRKALAKLNERGFASTSAEAVSSMGEHITRLIKQSGLSETAFSRRPFEPRAIVRNGPKPYGVSFLASFPPFGGSCSSHDPVGTAVTLRILERGENSS